MTLTSVRSLAFVCFLGIASATQAGTATYSGNTTGAPTFNRPLAGTPPTSLSAVGTAVHYTTQTFTVDLSGSYTFLSTATNPLNWDNFTFLYITAFNAASPITNALVGNDDNPSIGLSGFTINLTAGSSYIFVTTGFANTDVGAFTNTITGPGNILGIGGSAVPEAGPGMIGFAALIAALFVLRRHLAVNA